jgi:hypothetical protein
MLENCTHSLLSFSLYSIKTEHGVYKGNRGFNLTTYHHTGKGKKGERKKKGDPTLEIREKTDHQLEQQHWSHACALT